MNAPTPFLLLTQDDFLWQHWHALDSQHWLPERGHVLAELHRWGQQGHTLAVIDTGLPDLPAWQAASWQPLLHGVRTVVASARPSDEEGLQAMIAGALGYCHAYAPAVTLTHVLDSVTTGSVWMGTSLVNRLLRQVNTLTPASIHWKHEALTERERVIALHVSKGEPNGKIAAAMGVSERTVKAHLTSIFEKLKITDRLQLALLVHGITPAPGP